MSNSTQTEAFIEHVNSTPKRLVHNKLHDEIDKLKLEVAKWEKADSEKEMKLGLFKKTIATLQQQIQELNRTIQTLQNQTVPTSFPEVQQYEEKLKVQRNSFQQEIASLSLQLQNQVQQSTELSDTVKQLTTANNELKLVKEELIGNIELRVSLENQYKEQIRTLEANCVQHKCTIENLTDELGQLKGELQNMKSENSALSQQARDIQVQLVETQETLQRQLNPVTENSTTAPKEQESITGKPRNRTRAKKK